jgi:hypothetical protein
MTARHAVTTLALVCAAACGGGDDTDVGAAARIPAAVDLIGSYDVAPREGEPPAGIGTVMVQDEVFVDLTAPPVTLHGRLAHDGTLPLSGMTATGDAVLPVDGTARASEADRTVRISGTLNDGSSFVMVRRLDDDQSRASARYRLHLVPSPQPVHGDGTIDVDVRIEPNGIATAETDGAERAAAGNQIAAVSNPAVRVAPSGRFLLDLQYDFVAGSGCFFGAHCRVRVTGTLPASTDEPATRGSYVYALAPTFSQLSAGDAEIARLGALPAR